MHEDAGNETGRRIERDRAHRKHEHCDSTKIGAKTTSSSRQAALDQRREWEQRELRIVHRHPACQIEVQQIVRMGWNTSKIASIAGAVTATILLRVTSIIVSVPPATHPEERE